MVAVYPAGIKKFAYRTDFTNIVDAADVNVLYDEVTAVENILGPQPSWDNIDGVVNKWSTVSNRIAAVRQGVSKPYAHVEAHNVNIPFNNNSPFTWNYKTWDTHKMWNGGVSLVCPRTGVYTFDIYIRWHADNLPGDSQQPAFDRSGALGIKCLPVGANYELVDHIGYFPQGWQRSNHQAASITLPWTKGVAVEMVAYQNVLTTGLTVTAEMSITYHRDGPTTNNM